MKSEDAMVRNRIENEHSTCTDPADMPRNSAASFKITYH